MYKSTHPSAENDMVPYLPPALYCFTGISTILESCHRRQLLRIFSFNEKKKVNLFTSTKNFPKPRTWLFLNFMNYSCCFNWDRSYLVFWGGIFPGIGWKISSSVYWDVWRTGYIYRTVYAKKQNRVHWIGIREINTKPQSLFHIHVKPVSIKPRQEWQQYQHMQTLIN